LIGSGKGVLLARLSGVEDRNQAEALRGLRLYLPRAALPEPEPDEYYHADLIGLAATLADGTPVGRVRAVHDFGAGASLELDRSDASPVLVPFTRGIVPIVDLAAGRLVLDPPPGLLDLPGDRRSYPTREQPKTVMPGPDPGIHVSATGGAGRDKPGHDVDEATLTLTDMCSDGNDHPEHVVGPVGEERA